MTFHKLFAILELIVAGPEREKCGNVCAADDKRGAVTLFVLYRPTEG